MAFPMQGLKTIPAVNGQEAVWYTVHNRALIGRHIIILTPVDNLEAPVNCGSKPENLEGTFPDAERTSILHTETTRMFLP